MPRSFSSVIQSDVACLADFGTDATGLANGAAKQQKLLGQGGFPGIRVRNDGKRGGARPPRYGSA
jgi:hypothetical protein